MRTYEVKEKVDSLGVDLPPVERFWRLGDLTALRQDDHGRFYRANYERGILLYALVAKYRPTAVLEFGTGRGYGCLCMAWAMADKEISGRIYTIDMVPYDEPFEWAIDWGDGPRVERLARCDVWPKAAQPTWLERIHMLTGFSGQVMSRWHGPPIELAFIDGGHSFDVVRHDFYSVLQVAAKSFGILFDDYGPMPAYGVKRLIDEEVAPHFEAELIYTDRRWPGGERATLQKPEYGMVWMYSENFNGFLGNAHVKFLLDYRRRERWIRVRWRVSQIRRSFRSYCLRRGGAQGDQAQRSESGVGGRSSAHSCSLSHD